MHESRSGVLLEDEVVRTTKQRHRIIHGLKSISMQTKSRVAREDEEDRFQNLSNGYLDRRESMRHIPLLDYEKDHLSC